MKSKKTNRKFNFGNSRKEFQTNEPVVDEELYLGDEYDESKRLKLMLFIFLIPMIFLIGKVFNDKFNPPPISESEKQELIERKLAREAEQKGKKNANTFNQHLAEADKAFEENDYFKSVFNYRTALSYQRDIEVYKKLLSALKKSCESGNEIHCDEKMQNKIKSIIEIGL